MRKLQCSFDFLPGYGDSIHGAFAVFEEIKIKDVSVP